MPRQYQRKTRTPRYEDNNKFSINGRPEGDNKPNIGLSIKSLKDLPRSSITMKVDPYSNVNNPSNPYAILNGFNSKIGGSYSGDANLDGGNVQQYANSERSSFLKWFDFMRLKINLNYRYMPSKQTEIGTGLIDETIKTLTEAYSLLGATTYTALAINDYVIETDMNMGSASSTVIDGKTVFDDPGTVLYGISRWYQEFWTDIANSFNWHNSFRLKQGLMIRSAWNREVPVLNALFGLFNKKAWLNLLEGIAMSFEGEYIDSQFITQCAMLNVTPSRRSDSITDPVKEIQTKIDHCSYFRMYYKVSSSSSTTLVKIFDSDDMKYDVMNYDDAQQTTLTIWEVIDRFNDYLAAENIMGWARNNTYATRTGEPWFNYCKRLLDQIIKAMTYVKTKFSDFREALDVIARTGTVSWAKGYRPSITQATSAAAFDVLLVDDIFQLIMSGAHAIDFDNNTKRWRSFSLWNMYTGIPEYDSKQGGAFLSLSCKEIEAPQDDDGLLDYMPVALTTDDGSATSGIVYCTARDGVRATLHCEPVNMYSNTVLNRLVPLDSQVELSIKVPFINTNDSQYSQLTIAHKSSLYKTMLSTFGVARINHDNVEDFGVDPDMLAVYQYEIEDFTNMSIAYVKNNSPIRASTREGNFLGFFGTQLAK